MARFIPTKFEIYRDSTKHLKWANLVNENILLHTFHDSKKAATDLTDAVIKYASAYAPSLSGKKASLWDSLISSNRVREVDSDEVEWKLKGSGRVETLSTKNMMPGVKFPGHSNRELQISLDTEEFVPGDVIAPEVAKEIPLVIQYLPIKDGANDHIYTAVLADKNDTAYFDPELLEPGLKWVKITSIYGEASRGYGSSYFDNNTSYIRFRSELTDWGKSIEVTNKAQQLNLTVRAKDDMGKYSLRDFPDKTISWVEAEFLGQSKWEKELTIWYGRAIGKKILDPTSGYHRRMGPGVNEFFEDANIITYPLGNFSIDMIRDFLQEVGWDTISPENSNIIVKTGRMGMTQAHDSIRELYTMLNIQVPFEKWVSKGDPYPGSNSPGYRVLAPSFLSVDLFPYGRLTFEHLPILDNRELNGAVVHPDTGLPLTSYYYYIMDYGLGEHGNVELLRRKDSEVYTYICGVWSPAGPVNSSNSLFKASHSGRYFTLHAADTIGVRIKDVNLCALVLPNIQY